MLIQTWNLVENISFPSINKRNWHSGRIWSSVHQRNEFVFPWNTLFCGRTHDTLLEPSLPLHLRTHLFLRVHHPLIFGRDASYFRRFTSPQRCRGTFYSRSGSRRVLSLSAADLRKLDKIAFYLFLSISWILCIVYIIMLIGFLLSNH